MEVVSRRRAWLMPGLLAVLLLVTGCFQPSGAPDLPPTPAGQGQVRGTPTRAPGQLGGDQGLPTETPAPDEGGAGEGGMGDVTGLDTAPGAELTATAQSLYLTATSIVAEVTQTAAAAGGAPVVLPSTNETPTPGQADVGAQPGGLTPQPAQPTVPPTAQVVQPDQVPQSCVHMVERGENLFRIAQRYGVTVEQMATANNIANPSRIFTGQQLVIPNCVGGAASATQAPPPPQPGGGTRTHVVQRGETLFAIAQRYGVTVDQIVQANSIADPSRIYAGQTLVIP